jgi:DNA-binding NarL/FixJ family response regulator
MRRAQLSGGRLVLIDGSDVWGDAGQGIRAIESFLSELGLEGSAAVADAPFTTTSGLSQREMQVLRLVGHGLNNQQIADELVISINTVRRHVSNIFDKTGVANRAQAVAYARDHDIE